MTNPSPAWTSVLPQRIADAFPRSHSATRRALESTAELRSFAPGQTILRQGQESALALVVDGHVALQRARVNGRRVMMRVVSGGSRTCGPQIGIVLMSGYTAETLDRERVTARAARFVAKPVAVTELRHSIREALERGRMAGGTS